MSQLTMAAEPLFTETPEDILVVGQPLRHVAIQALIEDGKFGAVRCEYILEGFFKHGDTVPVSVSPVDGRTYAREEITYRVMEYSNRGVGGGFSSGMKTKPAISGSQPANLYWWLYNVDDATGAVSLTTSYYEQGGAETITNDGIVKVIAICQRQSDNAIPPAARNGKSGPSGTGTAGLTTPTIPGSGMPIDGGTGRPTYTVSVADYTRPLLFSESVVSDVILDAAATYLASYGDFWCSITNEGSADINIYPNGSETINGGSSLAVPPFTGVSIYAQFAGSGFWTA